jgi:hypothetical protein
MFEEETGGRDLVVSRCEVCRVGNPWKSHGLEARSMEESPDYQVAVDAL